MADKNLTASFVYFGLTFVVETVELPASIISSSKLTVPQVIPLIPDVVSVIEKERKSMEKNFTKFFKNKKLEPHFFKVTELLWIFCHGYYIKMSDVTVSLLMECGISISVHHAEEELFKCTIKSHKDHVGLEPFFKDNIFLKQYFSNLYNCTDGEYKVEIGSYLTTLNKILTQGLPRVHKYTIYHSNGIPNARSWEMTENEWTCRLSYCLPKYLPCGYLSSYTGDDGQQFDDLQWSYSTIKLSDMYIFQGAPDIILSKRKVLDISLHSGSSTEDIFSQDDTQEMDGVDMGSLETSDIAAVLHGVEESHEESTSEDEVVEAVRGTIPVCRVHGIPEKVGQLIAGLYFIAVAKLTRCLKIKEYSPQKLTVRGALVDKANGIILCELKIDVNSRTSVECTYHTTGSLDAAMLCSGIQKLIGKK